MAGTIRKIGPFTDTVRALNSRPSEMFIGRTDKQPGDSQHLDRVIARRAMGQKKTPIGGIKLRKAKK